MKKMTPILILALLLALPAYAAQDNATGNNGTGNTTGTQDNAGAYTGENSNNRNSGMNSTNNGVQNRAGANTGTGSVGTFTALDANSDGQLSQSEFTANNRASVDLFTKYDVNRDGKLSNTETSGYFGVSSNRSNKNRY